MSSYITLFGKHSHIHPLPLILIILQEITKEMWGDIFLSRSTHPILCCLQRNLKPRIHAIILDVWCNYTNVLLLENICNNYAAMVIIPKSCSIQKWHLSSSFQLNFFTLPMNQIANLNTTVLPGKFM